jgi:nucleoside-diphosphate-sugar epimerase
MPVAGSPVYVESRAMIFKASMRRIAFALSPNQARIAYDSLTTTAAALFVITYTGMVLDRPPHWSILCAPALMTAANWGFGIFSRHRVGGGMLKTPLLTGSLLVTSLAMHLLHVPAVDIVLWFALVWGPIVLPRIFLNFHSRPKADLLSDTIRQRGPVLVVGGAGYIGTHVVDQLLHAGYTVRVLDTFMYGAESLEGLSGDGRVEIIEGDATDIARLTAAMHGVSAVVHLAGLVGDPACAVDESFTRHTNVIATRMIKEVALSLGVPRFIFASSCSVYGCSEKEVDENSDLNPVSLYARTKIDSERELLRSIDETFCVTILRFATVFGHSRRPRFDLVANLFTAQALTEGRITVTGDSQWRPFIHVSDLARAIVKVLRAPERQVQGQIFNVGDRTLNLTIGQLADRVHELTSSERQVSLVKLPDAADRRNYFVSFDKIQSVLGFRASVTLDDGVREMIDHFRKGTYQEYRNPRYSNLEVTKTALSTFRDPLQSSRLYRPIGETDALPEAANM